MAKTDNTCGKTGGGKPRSVLVVDDEQAIGGLLIAVLRPDGYRVTALACAREACEELARRDYDFIICDWRMPGMSGRAFYDFVAREKPHLADKIIFMTGDYVGMSTHAFLTGGGHSWLKKPFRIGQLKDALKENAGVEKKRR